MANDRIAKSVRVYPFTPDWSFEHNRSDRPRVLGREVYRRADKDGQCHKVLLSMNMVDLLYGDVGFSPQKTG